MKKTILVFIILLYSTAAIPSYMSIQKESKVPYIGGVRLGWKFLERGDCIESGALVDAFFSLVGAGSGIGGYVLYDYEIVSEFKSLKENYYLVYEKDITNDEIINVYTIPKNGIVVKDEYICPPRVTLLIHHDIGKENEYLGIWVSTPIFDESGNYKEERKLHELPLDDETAQILIDLVTGHSKYKNKTSLEIEPFKFKYLYFTKTTEDNYYKDLKTGANKSKSTVMTIQNMISYPFGIVDNTIFSKTIQEVQEKYPKWKFKLWEIPEGVKYWDYKLRVLEGDGYDRIYHSHKPRSVDAYWKRGQKRNILSWRYEFLGQNNTIEEIKSLTDLIIKDLKSAGCICISTKTDKKKYSDIYYFKKGKYVIILYSSKRGVTLHIDKVKLDYW